MRNRSVSALAVIYSDYTLFALMITYLFRYEHWVEGGAGKIVNHIFIGGTLAALGCVLAVAVSQKFGEWLQTRKGRADLADSFARVRFGLVTAGMWLFALAMFVVQFHRS